METNFDQSPQTAEEQLEDETRQTLIGQIGSLLRSGYEAIPRNIRMGIAIGATVFVGAQAAELAFNAEPVSGEGNTPTRVSTPEAGAPPEATQSSTVLHRRSKLRIQPILNKIHHAVIPIDQEATVKPTSAFLTSSTGGFRTDCRYGGASYKWYEVTPSGIGWQSCGPGLPYTQQSTPNQFRGLLNRLGNNIQRSVGLSYDEGTARIGGNRKRITARYQCPAPETDPNQPDSAAVQPAGVAKIVIKRNHTAAVTTC